MATRNIVAHGTKIGYQHITPLALLGTYTTLILHMGTWASHLDTTSMSHAPIGVLLAFKFDTTQHHFITTTRRHLPVTLDIIVCIIFRESEALPFISKVFFKFKMLQNMASC